MSQLRAAVAQVRALAGTAVAIKQAENLMPALRLNFHAQGVDAWCASPADARDVRLATMRHIAVEGRCFVLAANQVARAQDLSPSFATSYADPGGGRSWRQRHRRPFRRGPRRTLLDEEGLLVADLDLDEVTPGPL